MKKTDWVILESLVPVILIHVPGPIVEIGMGVSTSILADCARKAGVEFLSCDKVNLWGKPTYEKHTIYEMLSIQFMEKFPTDIYPSVVFIDGAHTKDIVRKEFRFFLNRLADNGVIFLHDTLPQEESWIVGDKGPCRHRTGDVYVVRQEIEQNYDVDVFTWPYTAADAGLTMVRKRPKNRPYYQQ